MITVNFMQLELGEFWHDEAPHDRGRGGVPLVMCARTESLGMVDFEISPGDSLGTPTARQEQRVVLPGGPHRAAWAVAVAAARRSGATSSSGRADARRLTIALPLAGRKQTLRGCWPSTSLTTIGMRSAFR